MEALRLGYARCPTDEQYLTAQRDALIGIGVDLRRTYTDHGRTNRTLRHPELGGTQNHRYDHRGRVGTRTGPTDHPSASPTVRPVRSVPVVSKTVARVYPPDTRRSSCTV